MALRANEIDMSEAIIIRGSSNNGSSGIPVGCIVMWSGAVNNIPSGWALCNGSNGTPDLRNRFIVGAGDSYNVADKGGLDSVTLTISEIPSHQHTVKASNRYNTYDVSASGYGGSSGSGTLELLTGSYPAAYAAPVGGGKSHENRPPYYALCFIMYIG